MRIGILLVALWFCTVLAGCSGGEHGEIPFGNTTQAEPASAPALISITITSAVSRVVAGATVQFTATGTYSDDSTKNITNAVTWTSAAPSVATITSSGIVTGIIPGQTVIGAALASPYVYAEFQFAVTNFSLAGTVTEFITPTPNVLGLYGITAAPDGNVWIAETGAKKIAKVTPSGVITEYSVPSSGRPLSVTSGPDGNVWFNEIGPSMIGRVTAAGMITEYVVPSAKNTGYITSGPDGNLWFTEGNSIAKITTSGVITEYTLTSQVYAGAITSGPDGNLWFADTLNNKIAKMTTSGVLTEYTIPSGNTPSAITAGADGNMWFTENTANTTNKIGKITTSGVVTEYSRPGGAMLFGITAGPDGNIWYAIPDINGIGTITPQGIMTEHTYALTTIGIFGLAFTPDDTLWFTETNGSGKFGAIRPASQ